MKIGDIRKGNEIGFTDNHQYIWHGCVDCGKERWQLLRNGKPQTEHCASCAGKMAAKKRNQVGEHHPRWKGGRHPSNGYIHVWLSPDNPYYPMVDKDGYVYEHRLMMAEYLGRCLLKSEEVHHINGIRTENRIDNFELNSKSEHNRRYHADIKRLLLRIGILENQIKQLTASATE